MKVVNYSIYYFFLFLFFVNTTSGQTTITIGSGTSINSNTSYPAPYGNEKDGARHQFLILASELTAQGMTAGNIQSLAFNVAAAQGEPLNNFTVKIKTTSSAALTTTFQSAFTTVCSYTNYTETNGWNVHNFSTPFSWNGTSNLIIETCFNNLTTTPTNNAQLYYSVTTFLSTTHYSQDNNSTICTTNFGTTSFNRPNMQFTYVSASSLPIVNFTTNKTYSCGSGAVTFTDLSCCAATSREWQFGDGFTSALANPTHTYTASGLYNVKLKVTNANGTDSLIKPIYIALTGGPIATVSCNSTTPAATGNFGFGTLNFTFHTINNSTLATAWGYQNYTCSGATVYEGSNYFISVGTDPLYTHNIRVWVDYNNNGNFATSELLFSQDNTSLASGLVTIPTGAVYNTPLRVRVSSESNFSPVPAPCSNLVYGQAEDYTLVIVQNNNPPLSNFVADKTTTCNGTVNFTDLSTNLPTSWQWDFGDGFSSNSQNPTHTYNTSGVYNVSLTATNGQGSDVELKNAYINVLLGSTPTVAASCTPATSGYCCGYGIYNFNLNNIINKSSGSGAEGYQDFTCGQSATLTQSMSYPVSVQTGASNPQDTRIWLDANNDGDFLDQNELLFTSDNTINPTGNITIPYLSVLNTPLRLRVVSDYAGSAPTSCFSPTNGQVEDYTVMVGVNVAPPDANFTAAQTVSCNGQISFTDQSTYTNTWLWRFGDGTTSTLQNPVHTYAATGIYSVKLIASNGFGIDSLLKTNYVNIVSLLGAPVPATCAPTIAPSGATGIYNVTLNTINNSTAANDGYKVYDCTKQTSLLEASSYSISVQTSNTENVKVWMDFNGDGTFASSEEIFAHGTGVTVHTGTIFIPYGSITNDPIRMRVMSTTAAITSPCQTLTSGQTEDYQVVILPNTAIPVSNFSSPNTVSCNGFASFVNTSSFAISYRWDFGDGDTSILQNPTHTYLTDGNYTVQLITHNPYGNDTLTLTNYISVSHTGPVNATCIAPTASSIGGRGIFNVVFNAINNPTAGATDGYKDYTCSQQTNVITGIAYPFTITTGSTNTETVRIWIDYNNDGAFNMTNELIFSSNTILQTHTGSYTPPVSGVTFNTALRMRVLSHSNTSIASACIGLTGQCEDYTIKIIPNTFPPVISSITATPTSTCNGFVAFSQVSYNATSYKWYFGDGDSSILASPSHTYASNGNYTVKLVTCNVYGCDTLTNVNYVAVNLGGAINSTCISPTTNSTGGRGIFNVSLGSISNPTAGATDGYKDYSCSQQTSLITGVTYPLSITTSIASENVRVFIDYNNDGTFTTASPNESVYTHVGTGGAHTTNISIPSTGVLLNTPVRMRVISHSTTISSACMNLTGQCEDYTVTIVPNTTPPIITSTAATPSLTCNGYVAFSQVTYNGINFKWYFGDGDSSLLANPSHTYLANGNYTVQLIACNAYGCDTLTNVNYVNVTLGGPVNASCTSPTTSTANNRGIYNVTFGTINNSTAGAVDGYKDYTCSQQATLIAGDPYSFSVTTVAGFSENVKIWIDYNDDGVFNDLTETIFTHSGILNHAGSFVVPTSGLFYNTSLRMRIISNSTTITSACMNLTGQCEDYAVTIVGNTLPPDVDFTSNVTNISVGGSVNFTDLTIHSPVSRIWTFTGGSPSSSVSQNPTSIVYSTPGDYPVKLKASNGNGQDSLVKLAYIHVLGSFNMCSATTSTTLSTGNLYDPGGPSANYGYNQNCSFLIAPNCATSVTLTFTSFATESGYDFVTVYNGATTSSPVLLYASGGSLPSAVTANSGKMLVTFYSDNIYNYSGFIANWSSVLQTNLNAQFIVDDNTPMYNSRVSFTDQTVGLVSSRLWNFGDGFTSTANNPVHYYKSSGAKTVTLIVYGCNGNDTISQIINVQPAPDIQVVPVSYNVTVNSGDSLTVPFRVKNQSGGELRYNISDVIPPNPPQVLALTYGAPTVQYNNAIAAINKYFTEYSLSTVNTSNASVLQALLVGKKLLLIPEIISGSLTAFTNFGPVLQNFVSNGGTVIFCGSGLGGYDAAIFNTGLFTGFYAGSPLAAITINNPSHPIAAGVPNSIPTALVSYSYTVSNTDKQVIANIGGNDFITVRSIGLGKAILIGASFFTYNNDIARLIANAMRWGTTHTPQFPSWINFSALSDTVTASDSSTVDVEFNAKNMNDGYYSSSMYVLSNDAVDTAINVPYTMHVIGHPAITLSDSTIDFGSIFVNATKKDTIFISNPGTDTLTVSNIVSNNSFFTVNLNSFNILPGAASVPLIITYAPTAAGTFNATLTLFNNDVDTIIYISAIAALPPVAGVSPTSVSGSLAACYESVSIPLYISNTGGAPLTYSFSDEITDTAKILVYNNLATGTYYNNLISGLNLYFTRYTLSTTNTTSLVTFQAALAGKHVLIIPSNTGAASMLNTFSTAIQSFVSGGGEIIFIGFSGINQSINLGLFSGNFYTSTTFASMIVENNTHSISNGFPTTIAAQGTVYAANFTNNDVVRLVSYLSEDVVSYRRYGKGKVVYIGYNFASFPNIHAAQLIANSVNWSIKRPDWLTPSTLNGTLAVGSTDTVLVHLNSLNYPAGVYYSQLMINSNDVLSPKILVPCTLTVGNNLCVDFKANNTIVTPGSTVDFADLTVNSPQSWQWKFPGGTVSSSVLQNPSINYPTVGVYPVSLKTTKISGADSLTKEDYIIVADSYNMCGSSTGTSAPNGFLYDSGGPFGTYNDNQYCTFLIDPGCASSITLSFSSFVTESDYDYLFVYDGATTASPLILYTSGSDIPSPVTASSGKMLVVFMSDFSYVYSGFAATWTSSGGVGPSPVAQFIANTTTPPVNSPVTFTDLSSNAPTSWLWNFGDGTFSGLQNPVHNFTTSGTYPVSLIARKCDLADTITYIFTVQPPPAASVNQSSITNNLAACYNSSTSNVIISNTGGGDLYYQVTVTGLPTWLSVPNPTGTVQPGTNDTIDLDFTSLNLSAGSYSHNLLITTNDPSNPSIIVGCTLVVGNNLCVDFYSNITAVATGGLVNFFDNTVNNATSWEWTFPGGSPSSSILKNPANIVYNFPGTYPVKLKASNASGSDSLTKTAYINVLGTFNMCASGGSNATAGIIYDSGGPVGFYNTNESCSFLIDPGCATSITLTKNLFDLGYWWSGDVLRMYDGTNSLAPLLLDVTGDGIVPNTITANSGKVYIEFTSDNWLPTYQGFSFTWTSSGTNGPAPVAQFAANTNPPLNSPVSFVDQTTNSPGSWIWDFGDGTQDYTQNPEHTYTIPGNYTVTLVVYKCDYSDTSTQVITVQSAPVISTSPSSFSATLDACFDSSQSILVVSAGAAGGAMSYTISPGSLPTWVSLSSLSGIVESGESDTIIVTFKSGILTGGGYSGNIILVTNNTTSPNIVKPCVLIVSSNPCMDFSYNATGGCSGDVQFLSGSINNPTSWFWDFGDGSTSNFENPLHSYTAAGFYTVKHVGCNASGCDTIIKYNYVNVMAVGGPLAASCSPITTSACCGHGIFLVEFADINYASGGAAESYEDNTCYGITSVFEGVSYNLHIQTGVSFSEQLRVWIDFNNSGTFESTEMVMSSTALIDHNESILIPSGAVANTPLRMRISSDWDGSPAPTPCANVTFSQVEDYAIVIFNQPVAIFDHNTIDACHGVVQFTDLSSANTTSWFWDFGDGNSSTIEHPTNEYAIPGTYQVMLVAINANGSDTVTIPVTVNPFLTDIIMPDTAYVGTPVNFSSTNTNAFTWSWNFGDSHTSTAASPTNSYATTGTYIVKLNITDGISCSYLTTDTIEIIDDIGMANEISSERLVVVPNPNRGIFTIHYVFSGEKKLNAAIFDMYGQKVYSESTSANSVYKKEVNISGFAKGTYMLKIVSEKGVLTKMIVVQ